MRKWCGGVESGGVLAASWQCPTVPIVTVCKRRRDWSTTVVKLNVWVQVVGVVRSRSGVTQRLPPSQGNPDVDGTGAEGRTKAERQDRVTLGADEVMGIFTNGRPREDG